MHAFTEVYIHLVKFWLRNRSLFSSNAVHFIFQGVDEAHWSHWLELLTQQHDISAIGMFILAICPLWLLKIC